MIEEKKQEKKHISSTFAFKKHKLVRIEDGSATGALIAQKDFDKEKHKLFKEKKKLTAEEIAEEIKDMNKTQLIKYAVKKGVEVVGDLTVPKIKEFITISLTE